MEIHIERKEGLTRSYVRIKKIKILKNEWKKYKKLSQKGMENSK